MIATAPGEGTTVILRGPLRGNPAQPDGQGGVNGRPGR